MFHGEFVGREPELDCLERALARAMEGKLSVCMVTGGPGTGKSRLIGEFVARARTNNPDLLAIIGECNAQTGRSQPYLPFIELVGQLVGEAKDRQAGPPAGVGSRLGAVASVALESLLAVAPDLLGLMVPGVSTIAATALAVAERRGWTQRLLDSFKPKRAEVELETIDRKRIFEQYTALIHGLAASFPLVLIVDDLQWSDESSLALFYHLIFKRVELPLLIIGSYRTAELDAQLHSRGQSLDTAKYAIIERYGEVFIDLDRLPQQERRCFVEQYLTVCRHRFDAGFVERLLEITAGQPLLLGELLVHLSERGRVTLDGEGYWVAPELLDWSALPTRVEGVIAERLERLDPRIYDVLEVASVQGRSFVVSVVARILGLDELELVKLLARELDARHHLVNEAAIERIGERWLATYSFDNIQLQQYLYSRISQRGRMLLHAQVAELLEDLYADYPGPVERVLAFHHECGGSWRKAAHFHRAAGARAFRLGAGREAITHFERALALLDDMPADAEVRELKIQTYLPYSNVLKVTYGWNSPEILDALYRARALCRELGAEEQLMPFLFSLWAHHLTNLDLAGALATARENTALGERLSSVEVRVHGHFAQANTEFWLGDFEACARNVALARELCEQIEDFSSCSERYGQDPRALVLQFDIMTSWVLGERERVEALLGEGERMLAELEQPLSKGIMLTSLAWQAFNDGDVGACRRHAEELLRVTEALVYYRPFSELFLGWVDGVEGNPQVGLERVERAYAQMGATSESLLDPVEALIACDLLVRLGRVTDARLALERSLARGLASGSLAYRAELLRVSAELAGADERERAGQILRDALALAERQGAIEFIARIRRSLEEHDNSAMAEVRGSPR